VVPIGVKKNGGKVRASQEYAPRSSHPAVVFTGAYLVFSFALLTVFALTLLIQGASTAALIGFLTAWLVPTYLLVRFWHRRPQREAARPGA